MIFEMIPKQPLALNRHLLNELESLIGDHFAVERRCLSAATRFDARLMQPFEAADLVGSLRFKVTNVAKSR